MSEQNKSDKLKEKSEALEAGAKAFKEEAKAEKDLAEALEEKAEEKEELEEALVKEAKALEAAVEAQTEKKDLSSSQRSLHSEVSNSAGLSRGSAQQENVKDKSQRSEKTHKNESEKKKEKHDLNSSKREAPQRSEDARSKNESEKVKLHIEADKTETKKAPEEKEDVTKKDATEEKKEEVEKEKIEKEIKKDEEKKEKKADKPKSKKTDIVSKKDEAVAKGLNLRVSKKQSVYICSFIKNMTVDEAIHDLQAVILMKKVVPFRGEIPHRKGKGMMSGRFPTKAAKIFITVLKGLKGNIMVNGLDIDNSKIYFASATFANRPMRRGNRKAKRTNVILKAKEIKN